ncbi:hypothetical protein Y032_0021g378 [Ancylostoma ceylanicum]|uniref:Uncharacterized protein n=1 Tax=Ancylostoma ceylanicum TaxID=53326 RepID=A0A016UZ57_9BILA|nr:hypothetical protein Y032_0021g378 [Ancylostoma ceylanicum]
MEALSDTDITSITTLSLPTSSTPRYRRCISTLTDLLTMSGERKVQRVKYVQRKYFRKTTRMVFKTPVEHL